MATEAELKAYASAQATAHGIPTSIFLGLIGTESSWNPNAVSSKGAEGIAQLEPATAPNINRFDPFESLSYAAKLLRGYYDRFGSWSTALAAYNAGPGAVTKYGGIPPYPETQSYIQKILGGMGFNGGSMQGSLKVIFWAAAALIGIIILGSLK
jgi:soluble lytic murein transglycosylase-like protein